jgi:hypothetical protein
LDSDVWAASKTMFRVAERIPALHDIDALDELSFHPVSEVSTGCSARQHTSQMQATDRGKGEADALQDS